MLNILIMSTLTKPLVRAELSISITGIQVAIVQLIVRSRAPHGSYRALTRKRGWPSKKQWPTCLMTRWHRTVCYPPRWMHCTENNMPLWLCGVSNVVPLPTPINSNGFSNDSVPQSKASRVIDPWLVMTLSPIWQILGTDVGDANYQLFPLAFFIAEGKSNDS